MSNEGPVATAPAPPGGTGRPSLPNERDVASQDYWSIVFRQLKKSRLGLAGLAVVLLLYVMAVCAPFLAESKPIRLVHANPDDKACLLCKDLGISTKRVTLSDGRVWLGRIVKSGPDMVTFEHDGVVETIDRKTLAPKFEDLPRQHGPIATYPLFRAMDAIDLSLLLSLACLVILVPAFIVVRRRGGSRARAFAIGGLLIGPLLVIGIVWIAFIRVSDVNKLNQLDFRAVAEKRLRPGDSAWWAVIRHSPTDQDKRVRDNTKPSWMALKPDELKRLEEGSDEWEKGWKSHPLGTDDQRRDIAARMIHATRISLSVGFFSVAIYVTIGILVGSIAGYFGGWVDAAFMRVVEIIMCFPTLFLIITILAIVPPNLFWVMGTIAFVGWTGVARLVRAEFLKLRQLDYVQAARALGASRVRIIFRHVLPNALSPVFVSATFGIAGAILTESSLSFLGIGVPLDAATWGNVLRLARPVVTSSPWEALWPGLAIFLTMTSFNLFGEAMRDAMDPRLKT